MRVVDASESLYRAALVLCPVTFRREYGEQMLLAFRQLAERVYRERGLSGLVVLLVRSLVDLGRTAFRERMGRRRGRRQRMVSADLFRWASRGLKARPGASMVSILTLGLGIGATSAIFGTAYQVLIEPLPFRDPGRLMALRETDLDGGGGADDATPANFEEWRSSSGSFEAMAAMVGTSMSLTDLGEPARIEVQRVSAELFPLLGVEPALGRAFFAEEDRAGAPRVVLLTDGSWKRLFGGDAGILGRDLTLDGERYRIIGVLPRGFGFPSRAAELFVPLAMSEEERSARRSHYLDVVARLAPKASIESARQEMDSLAHRLGELYPETNADNGVGVLPLRDALAGSSRQPVLVLLLATAFVLLVAAVNVSGLLLARASARVSEVAVRSALGASRLRLTGELLAESAALSLLGGLLALLFAAWVQRFLQVLVPMHLVPRDGFLEPVTLGLTALLAATLGLGVGLVPALVLARAGTRSLLRTRDFARGTRARSFLVAVQCALTLVLLASAGLMLESFRNLQRVPTGFQPDNVLTMRVELSPARYAEHGAKVAFYRDLIERVERLPGVVSAGVVTTLPLTFRGGSILFEIEGAVPDEGPGEREEPIAVFRSVSPDYFRSLGVELRAGRMFQPSDDPRAPRVAVVNGALSRRFFGGDDPLGPLGRRIRIWGDPHEIVGVVADVRELDVRAESAPAIYVPFFQRSFGFFDPRDLAVRTRTDPLDLAASVRAEVWSIDGEQPISRVGTLSGIVEGSLSGERRQTGTTLVFGLAALLLSALGIYGVLSQSVVERTWELGLRKALGAREGEVLALVVRQGMLWSAAGGAAGLAVTAFTTRLLQGMLYGVEPRNPATLGGVVLLLLGVALVACAVPALRASRIDPLVALRQD